MRHLALVAGIALLVVSAWYVLSGGLGTSARPLSGVEEESDRDPAYGTYAGAGSSKPGAAAAGAPGASGKPPRKRVGLEGLCDERGEVGAAVYEIIRKTVGQDARQLDRRFALEDISRVVAAWHKNPGRKDEDIDFLVEVWGMMKDPTARYALSWLFRHGRDDRLVEPLMELVEHHPWIAIDAIADQGTTKAIRAVADLRARLEKPAERNQAVIRVARSNWDGATSFLEQIWQDDRMTDSERFVAVESLARRVDDPEARLKAYDIALGAPQPLADLGHVRNKDHPVRDLRSAAVMAVMQSGDQNLARKLISAADSAGADEGFASMVDLHIGSYYGADISRLVLDRVDRRRKVTLGEARYLNRVCTQSDLDRLHQMVGWAESPEARHMIQAAIMNAANRAAVGG